jgi:hypothetical protein
MLMNRLEPAREAGVIDPIHFSDIGLCGEKTLHALLDAHDRVKRAVGSPELAGGPFLDEHEGTGHFLMEGIELAPFLPVDVRNNIQENPLHLLVVLG